MKGTKMKFKINDYVRDISPENGGIFQITNEAQLEQANLDSSYIAWIPKEGEWYFDNLNKELLKCDYVEYIDDILYVYGTTTKDVPFNSPLTNCEPFIDKLPSFIKDKQ